VKIAYYFICHTKLWLFSHNITLENEHENVKIGKFLHEDRYKRRHKEEMIHDLISIDFAETSNGLILHEIKKTRKMEKAHRFQMLYYLHYLKSHGVSAKGIINYPLINKKDDVFLTMEDEKRLMEVIDGIKEVVFNEIPSPNRRKICNKCAYQEFCFGDDP
jgi:CRISPR-associated exonuclease Cas4